MDVLTRPLSEDDEMSADAECGDAGSSGVDTFQLFKNSDSYPPNFESLDDDKKAEIFGQFMKNVDEAADTVPTSAPATALEVAPAQDKDDLDDPPVENVRSKASTIYGLNPLPNEVNADRWDTHRAAPIEKRWVRVR